MYPEPDTSPTSVATIWSLSPSLLSSFAFLLFLLHSSAQHPPMASRSQTVSIMAHKVSVLLPAASLIQSPILPFAHSPQAIRDSCSSPNPLSCSCLWGFALYDPLHGTVFSQISIIHLPSSPSDMSAQMSTSA